MTELKINQTVRLFIESNIDSVETLEVLLLTRAHPDREWSAGAVARELRSNPASAAKRLADLCLKGMMSLRITPDLMYRYYPASDEKRVIVDELAKCYAQHRVSVIKIIFSKPNDKISVFADAFRLRGDHDR